MTGIIAPMLDAQPNRSADDVESVLKKTERSVSIIHPNYSSGWGGVDALSAVSAVLP
jgi:hypothetical protein